jgi:hypothetical protein
MKSKEYVLSRNDGYLLSYAHQTHDKIGFAIKRGLVAQLVARLSSTHV